MKKKVIVALCLAVLFTGCANEFNKVYKTNDTAYKYELHRAVAL